MFCLLFTKDVTEEEIKKSGYFIPKIPILGLKRYIQFIYLKKICSFKPNMYKPYHKYLCLADTAALRFCRSSVK